MKIGGVSKRVVLLVLLFTMAFLVSATLTLITLSSVALAFTGSSSSSSRRIGISPYLTTPFGSSLEGRRDVSVKMIGGFVQGLFGKKTADITDTAFFDISIDGKPAGRIELGLYGTRYKNLLVVLKKPRNCLFNRFCNP